MEITEQVKEKEVVDYTFLLAHNMQLSQTLDAEAGDFITEEPDRYVVYLASKPSPIDEKVMMTPEAVTVFKSQLMAMMLKPRKRKELTDEEKFERVQTLHKLWKTVQ